jgi:GST-like protein
VPYAITRYSTETRRLYGVLDHRLGQVEYLAGAYSIADIATYPWVARWAAAIASRPAVKRGMAVPG